jgi:opacity protein-like surface antigen
MNNQKLIKVTFLLMSFFALPVRADFNVQSDPTSDVYGNGQTGSFQRAIGGAGSVFTPQEQDQLSSMLPERDDQRYYGRFRLNFSTLTLDSIKNLSSDPTAMLGAIAKKRSSANQVGFEVAIGYSWSSNVRGDIEYLANKNTSYVTSPALIGGGIAAVPLNAQIKNNTLLANVYYDFTGVYRFRPYITAGIGPAVNSVTSTLTPGGANTTRSLKLAWGLGAGVRVGIFSRWFLDCSYRYINLGNALNIQPIPTVTLQGTYNMNALSVGFIYLF